jgi:hypothetical protein
MASSGLRSVLVRQHEEKALENRIAAFGRSGSWSFADLDSLAETEIGHDGKRFTVRSAPSLPANVTRRKFQP